MTIILYDITTRTGETGSPNSWKTKFSLILKGLSFEVKLVPLHELQKILPSEGIPPSAKKPDGTPFYTVPAIHDLATGIKLADSWEIALYLDRTYPETQRLFSAGTAALQRAFYDSFDEHFISSRRFWFTGLADFYPAETRPYIVALLERISGLAFDQILLQGEEAAAGWQKFKAGLTNLEAWYAASDGLFVMGDKPVFVDLAVVGLLLVQRSVFGEDSKEWKDIASWNGGRWSSLVAYFDKLNIAQAAS